MPRRSCRLLSSVQQIGNRPPTSDRAHVGPPNPGQGYEKSKRDPLREDRIHNEAIVDARPEEQAMSWYYYLEGKISFPFRAKCLAANASRRSERVKPSRSYAWQRRICASTICLCRSVGRVGRSPSLYLNWPRSILTNQPKKPSATGITGVPRATASNLRTGTESSQSCSRISLLRNGEDREDFSNCSMFGLFHFIARPRSSRSRLAKDRTIILLICEFRRHREAHLPPSRCRRGVLYFLSEASRLASAIGEPGRLLDSLIEAQVHESTTKGDSFLPICVIPSDQC